MKFIPFVFICSLSIIAHFKDKAQQGRGVFKEVFSEKISQKMGEELKNKKKGNFFIFFAKMAEICLTNLFNRGIIYKRC